MVATGRCHLASGRFQRGPNPLESRPDALRVRSPSLDVFMIDRTLKLLLTGRWENTVSASDHSCSVDVRLPWTGRTLDIKVRCSVRSLLLQWIFKIDRAACSQSSPNSNKIQINTNWDWCEWPLSNPHIFQKYFALGYKSFLRKYAIGQFKINNKQQSCICDAILESKSSCLSSLIQG